MNNKKSLKLNQASEKFSQLNYINRRDFMKLSIVERRRILEEQAEAMLEHYQQDQEWQELQTGDIIEY
ncbi:unknown protein [Stanieria sp. NIES-3757]|nr:unknown protein [Stanieria sp. NIES-3757]